jgi:hypothetical protein
MYLESRARDVDTQFQPGLLPIYLNLLSNLAATILFGYCEGEKHFDMIMNTLIAWAYLPSRHHAPGLRICVKIH